jgi:hypothetical protein
MVTVSLTGFGGEETVDLRWRDTSGMLLGTTETHKDGSGTIEFRIPAEPGRDTDFVAIGQSTDKKAWGSVEVVEPSSTPSYTPSSTPLPT